MEFSATYSYEGSTESIEADDLESLAKQLPDDYEEGYVPVVDQTGGTCGWIGANGHWRHGRE